MPSASSSRGRLPEMSDRSAADLAPGHDTDDLAGRAAVAPLAALIEDLPEDLRHQALTHSSWTERRVDSFERLAFLGDSVLGLSVAGSLYERFPDVAAGGLTKIHNQAVSGVSCAAVGRLLGVPEMLRASEPSGITAAIPAEVLLDGERPLPEATEALIGACHIAFGFERTSAAGGAGGAVGALPHRLRLRAHLGGGGGGLRAADRAGLGDADRLQERPAGAAGAPRGAGQLRGDGRHGTAAPADVRGGGDRRIR